MTEEIEDLHKKLKKARKSILETKESYLESLSKCQISRTDAEIFVDKLETSGILDEYYRGEEKHESSILIKDSSMEIIKTTSSDIQKLSRSKTELDIIETYLKKKLGEKL